MNDVTGTATSIHPKPSDSGSDESGEEAHALIVGHARIASRDAQASTARSATLRGIPARDVITATEICRFAQCRHQHLFADLRGFRETRLNLEPYSANEPLPASVYGDLVHDTLRRFHEGIGSAIPELVLSAVSAHPALHVPIKPETRDRIVEEVRQTLAHPCTIRLRGARLWPAPRFHLRLTPWLTVTGEMDLVAQWPDGRVEIVDYKTDRMPVSANDIAWREERVHHHALQAAIYTMACESALGPVSRFDFIFTHQATAAAAPVDAVTLADARRRVLEIAAVVTSGDPELYGEPYWKPVRCGGCPWFRVCRPAGQPTSP